ncbi:MAG: hypothetical protein ABIG64_04125 [Candidatus Omnitrophota bacterium]
MKRTFKKGGKMEKVFYFIIGMIFLFTNTCLAVTAPVKLADNMDAVQLSQTFKPEEGVTAGFTGQFKSYVAKNKDALAAILAALAQSKYNEKELSDLLLMYQTNAQTTGTAEEVKFVAQTIAGLTSTISITGSAVTIELPGAKVTFNVAKDGSTVSEVTSTVDNIENAIAKALAEKQKTDTFGPGSAGSGAINYKNPDNTILGLNSMAGTNALAQEFSAEEATAALNQKATEMKQEGADLTAAEVEEVLEQAVAEGTITKTTTGTYKLAEVKLTQEEQETVNKAITVLMDNFNATAQTTDVNSIIAKAQKDLEEGKHVAYEHQTGFIKKADGSLTLNYLLMPLIPVLLNENVKPGAISFFSVPREDIPVAQKLLVQLGIADKVNLSAGKEDTLEVKAEDLSVIFVDAANIANLKDAYYFQLDKEALNIENFGKALNAVDVFLVAVSRGMKGLSPEAGKFAGKITAGDQINDISTLVMAEESTWQAAKESYDVFIKLLESLA